jgi:hypothetical protein
MNSASGAGNMSDIASAVHRRHDKILMMMYLIMGVFAHTHGCQR